MKPAALPAAGFTTLCPYRFSAYAIVTATGTPSPRPWARNAITVSVVTAYGEPLGHFLDALQPEPAVLPRVQLIITSSKLREVLLENALQEVLCPWQIAWVGLWGWLPWRHLLL